MTAFAIDVRELDRNEIELVTGADRGDAAVAGVIFGAGAGAVGVRGAIQGASWGARLGAFGGPVGLIVGGVVGGVAGYFIATRVYDAAT